MHVVTALTTKAPIRLRFKLSTDINTSFTAINILFFGGAQYVDSSSTITSKKVDCNYKIINSDGTFEFLPGFSCDMTFTSPYTKVILP